uniref:HNH endonuclease signature motif containing protein n=1 Tax=Gordonia sp. B7-2 TaxID=3420932 RepID=UPI003D8F3CCE
MFTFTDPVADDAAIRAASTLGLEQHAMRELRHTRRAEARTVLLAHKIGVGVYNDMLGDPDPHRADPVAAEKAAVGEVSLRVGVSRSTAHRWIELGIALTGMDKVRLAYLDGDLATSRALVITRALEVLAESVRVEVEPLALELAARPTLDTTLRSQLAELIITLDPDAAADAREDFGDRHQNVIVRDDAHGHASIDATVPAEHGEFLRQRLAQLIGVRVCRHDPRTLGRRRVVALAELHGLPGARLTCECGRADCPTGTASPAVPASLEPEGPAPEPESFDAAEPSDSDPEAAMPSTPDPQCEPHADGSEPADTENVGESGHEPFEARRSRSSHLRDREDEPAGEPDEADSTLPSVTVITDPAGVEVPYLDGYGAIDPAHAAQIAEQGVGTQLELPETGIRPAWSGLIIGERGPAPPIDPSGHGGYDTPPRGATIYRPLASERAKVLATDRTCRYPFCAKPASECEIDHPVKFNHADPEAGGWTVHFNLAPLCTPDHHRKHFGLWIPVMCVDRSILWTNPVTGQQHRTYPR